MSELDASVAASIEPAAVTGYLADGPFRAELESELAPLDGSFGPLLLRAGPLRSVAWALDQWLDPVWIRFGSVGQAARALRSLGRRWCRLPWRLHRRAALIEQAVRSPRPSPLGFPPPSSAARWGGWLLVDEQTIFAASRCSSPFALGRAEFVEDHQGPPSRAYRKLWECFTRIGRWPEPGERCLDLGASPGSWTWALAELGARVVAVDKAPLDARIRARPGVRELRASAFAIDPRELGPVDWLLSDVVCYPAALLRLVRRWLDAGGCRRAICTVKLQGPTDHATLRELRAIDGATLMHLSHNRHELTWVWPRAQQ